jgi:hypothetical protein
MCASQKSRHDINFLVSLVENGFGETIEGHKSEKVQSIYIYGPTKCGSEVRAR